MTNGRRDRSGRSAEVCGDGQTKSISIRAYNDRFRPLADRAKVVFGGQNLMEKAAKVPGGWCVIRIPTVSSFAWEHYREQWVQLDAPRHFFLHKVRKTGKAT